MSQDAAAPAECTIAVDGVILQRPWYGAAATIPRLRVRIDSSGIAASGAPLGGERVLLWRQVFSPRLSAAETLPDGTRAIPLDGSWGAEPVRWMFPADRLTADDADDLEALVSVGRSAQGTAVPRGGAWDTPALRKQRSTPRRRRGTWTLRILACAVLLLALAGVGIGLDGTLAGSGGPQSSAPTGPTEIAKQVNVVRADLPNGWSVDVSPDNPLSPFLSVQSPNLTPSEKRNLDKLAAQFEQCMGISPSSDRIFGSLGAPPIAEASSPAFRAPSSSLQEAGSQSQVQPSRSDVSADLAQITMPKFPTCFGNAIGQEVQSAVSLPGLNVGTPQVQPLLLPQSSTVRAAGLDLTVPVNGPEGNLSDQLGFVLMGGGRVETTLFTFSGSSSFPGNLTLSLTRALEGRIAADGNGTGV